MGEIRKVRSPLQETKFQWLQDNNTIIILACITTQQTKTVMRTKKMKAG